MPHSLRFGALAALRPLPLAIVIAFAGTASAETSPYYVGISQSFTHQDNVYRRADGVPGVPIVSDTISSTGVNAGIDQPFGRQRFFASGNAAANKHRNQKQLDNNSYGLTAGLDWSTIERLSGNVRLSANRNLASYGDDGSSATTERNIQTSHQLSLAARYGLAANIGVEAGADRRKVKFSAADDQRGFEQDSANVGVRWGGSGQLSVGLSGRVSKGTYPNVQTTAGPPPTFATDEIDRKDLSLNVVWTPTGLSTITARLSQSREEHSLAFRPEFKGTTGELSWDYRPSGKLGVRASFVRDTGTETTFRQVFLPGPLPIPVPGADPVRVDSNRLSNSWLLSTDYEVTAKIHVAANARQVRASSGSSSAGTVSSYGLSASYAPTRTISLGCNVSRDERSGVYDANTYGCSARLTLR